MNLSNEKYLDDSLYWLVLYLLLNMILGRWNSRPKWRLPIYPCCQPPNYTATALRLISLVLLYEMPTNNKKFIYCRSPREGNLGVTRVTL